jgi:L-threonylcarbamoyladenylate synthase
MEESLTKIVQYSPESIANASVLLKEGKLVAFPTETVYGLGANALNADACNLIFTAKGRPLTDPLIVHVHNLDHGLSLIDHSDPEIVEIFKKLAGKYWPGPLTMVVKADMKLIPALVTANTGFVGIRMPNNEIALNLIKSSGLPLAAPSANKFGHVSPTKAEHVYNDFHLDSEVMILDGGSCSFGIESTVLKIYKQPGSDKPIQMLILRRGGVSEDSLS